AIENVSGSPSGSNADGAKTYSWPCSTLRVGEPVMSGGLFWDGAVTVIENAASAALSTPSLTLIVMPSYVPTSPSPGVPDNCPVGGSKPLHTGPFCSENVRMSPSTSSAVGVNEYSVPAGTVAGGAPGIVGGVFTPGSRTTIWTGGSV